MKASTKTFPTGSCARSGAWGLSTPKIPGTSAPRLAALAGAAIGLAASLASPSALADEPFSYNPPGTLLPGSGDGRFDEKVYAPGMRFPIETGPAYLNSQVWGHGGSQGPGGGQCDPENRQYPWWDNYCETRTWDMPLCPSGMGHQGQDMRAADCENDVHWVVAAADGEITSIGSYSVYLTTDDGTRFDYLHMGSVQVSVGQEVKRGERLGKVSNEFGGTPTTLHLHFNIQQNVAGVGLVFVPPYMSLIASYQELIGKPAEGELASATCERVRGASADPDTPDTPNEVRVSIGGAPDAPGAFSFDVTADQPGDSLCGEGGAPCLHGFDAWLPVSLLDGRAREVRLYALDTAAGFDPVELAGSPAKVACGVFPAKETARRALSGDAFDKWGFSLLFDQLPLAPEDAGEIQEGAAFLAEPALVASESGELWMLDGEALRAVSEDAASAFRLDAGAAEVWTEAERAAAKVGEPWPGRPVIVRGEGGALFLLDPGARVEIEDGPDGDGPDVTASGEVSCACRVTRPEGPSGVPAGAFVGLALGLGFARIRRRRARRSTRASGVL